MKKNNNNKFRGNNSVNSLNYKYDSVSFAGKISGTALDLIKRYNELAKEAQSNGNYVEMEVFRQYAEHYRKIVTEVNERKNQAKAVYMNPDNNANNVAPEKAVNENTQPVDNGLVETEAAEPADSKAGENQPATAAESVDEAKPATGKTLKLSKNKVARSFTVVEVKEETSEPERADVKSEDNGEAEADRKSVV